MADLTSHEAAAHEAHALPVMLPPGKLVGRDVILARVYSQLKENKPVLVYGAAGIGKTALAATLASAYTELPGGVLWLNVDNTPFPEILARIGRAYAIKELATSDNPLSLVGAAMSTLVGARPLIVFDGKIDVPAVSEFIMRCADRLPVLVISEQEVSGPWTSVALDKLEMPAAATLFKHLAPERVEGLDELIAALDGIPLAVIVAAGAARAKAQTPAEFLAALPPRPEIPPTLKALTVAFSGLSSALQGLLLLMGATLRGESSVELFSMIAGAPEETIAQALNVLAQQHMVERFQRYGKPYYRLHATTHTFAQTWLRGSGRLAELQNRVRDAILGYARKNGSTPDNLAAEMENFLALARWAAEQGDRDVANQLAVALMQAGDFVNARGYVYELLLLRRLAASSTSAFPAHSELQQAMPFAEAEPAEEADEAELEVEDEAAEDEDEALVEDLDEQDEDFDEDEFDEDDDGTDALFEHAEALIAAAAASESTALDDAEDEDDLDAEDAEDEEAFDQDDLDAEDEDDFDDEDEEESDELDELEIIAGVEAYEESADSEESEAVAPPEPADELARLRALLVAARQSGNRRQQADLLSALGREQETRGQESEAIVTYSDALSIYEALDDSPGLLATLEALASLIIKTDNAQAAVLHAQRGVKLAEELGNDVSQRKLLTILGDAHQQLGESDEAIRVYGEALDLARTAADETNEALILYKLGYAQLDSGDPTTATQTWEDALTRFREGGRRDYEGRTLAGLGTASGELERWNEAVKFYTSALYIAREVRDRDEEMLRLIDLAYAAVQMHQLGQAVLRYRQALHLAYASGSRESVVSITVDLGRLLVESQRHLDITELLVDAASAFEPNDRDLRRLKERIQDERDVIPPELKQVPVAGTAQDYAANAYSLLDNA